MAHELEFVDGKAQMAFVGEVPWHGLGVEVPADLTPAQMLKAAGLDWEVEKIPAFAKIDGKQVKVGHSALVRKTDHKMLTVVTDDWNPVQNQEAFEFFHEFVMNGEMEMNTAGSLRNGQIVWGLARVKESFEAVKGDRVDSYLLFTNFHRFGFATDVRFTPIRVVCNNTLTASLNQAVERMVKISHRKEFVAEDVKVMLGIAHKKMEKYKEMAQFLATKMATKDQMLDYFKSVFPMTTKNPKKVVSKNAEQAMALADNQPGAEYGRGSFWQLFNTVTYMTDHLLGQSPDTRLTAAWYGYNKPVKIKALETAVEMANAA
jgi:phage/plasmid-like protein (TIGR03299 family)